MQAACVASCMCFTRAVNEHIITDWFHSVSKPLRNQMKRNETHMKWNETKHMKRNPGLINNLGMTFSATLKIAVSICHDCHHATNFCREPKTRHVFFPWLLTMPRTFAVTPNLAQNFCRNPNRPTWPRTKHKSKNQNRIQRKNQGQWSIEVE